MRKYYLLISIILIGCTTTITIISKSERVDFENKTDTKVKIDSLELLKKEKH